METRPPRVLSCGRIQNWTGGGSPFHRHPGLELILIGSGRVEIRAGDRDLALGPGCLLRVPANCAHDQRDLTTISQTHVVIDAGGAPQPVAPERFQLGPDEPVAGWITDLVALNLSPGGSPTVESALITAILERLDQLAGRAEERRRLPTPVAAVVRHCEADPLADEDEASLAVIAGISPSHLRALFREHLGQPPGEFRRNLRLQLAQKLLCSSYLGIAEVAAACGWDDANYFARLFRSRCGQSPRAFRRAHRA